MWLGAKGSTTAYNPLSTLSQSICENRRWFWSIIAVEDVLKQTRTVADRTWEWKAVSKIIVITFVWMVGFLDPSFPRKGEQVGYRDPRVVNPTNHFRRFHFWVFFRGSNSFTGDLGSRSDRTRFSFLKCEVPAIQTGLPLKQIVPNLPELYYCQLVAASILQLRLYIKLPSPIFR